MSPIIEPKEIIERNFIAWNIPRPQQEYTVLIHCSTYNHGKYIEEALNGFIMQKTDFPFCAIVIDDGSPDNTADIVREYARNYPDIIKPICLGENHMQHGKSRNPYFDEWYLHAKYIAQCEGDDYWTDPLKLQKQIDFLDSHPDYSLVCSDANNFIQKTGTLINIPKWPVTDFDINDLIIHDYIATNTVCISSKTYFEFLDLTKRADYPKNLSFGDYPLWLFCVGTKKGRKLNEVMGVYRILEESASHFTEVSKKIKWFNDLKKVLDFFITNFNVKEHPKYMSNFLMYRHWGVEAALIGAYDFALSAVEFYKKNGHWLTALLVKNAKAFPKLKFLWSYIDRHNHIKPHTKHL